MRFRFIKNIKLDQGDLVKSMINLYCRKKHNTRKVLCDDCNNLLLYSQERLVKCPYGEAKPVCSNCKIHCYKKEYKEKIKVVMQYSGPRIIWHKPIAGIKYLIRKKFYQYPRRTDLKK